MGDKRVGADVENKFAGTKEPRGHHHGSKPPRGEHKCLFNAMGLRNGLNPIDLSNKSQLTIHKKTEGESGQKRMRKGYSKKTKPARVSKKKGQAKKEKRLEKRFDKREGF